MSVILLTTEKHDIQILTRQLLDCIINLLVNDSCIYQKDAASHELGTPVKKYES